MVLARAGIPYFAFVLSGYYTWSKFRFWADLAHQIEFHGLREHFSSEIGNIRYLVSMNKKVYETNLYDSIQDDSTEQKHQPIKRLLDLRKNSFTIMYLILVSALTIIAYWNFLIKQSLSLLFIFPIIGLCLVTVLLGLIYRKAKNKRDKDRITRIEEKQKNRKTRA